MKEIFNSLNQTEKRILEVVFLLLVLAFFFLVFIALKERNTYYRSLSSLSSKEKDYQKLNLSKMEKQRERLSWEKARQDIEELKKDYFYDEGEGINRLRLDLQRIFDECEIDVSPEKRYSYTKFEKESIRKVNISFDTWGSYFSLKKFIDSVEKLPMFLVIERIDFLDTTPKGSPLRLKITLAGYYAL